MGWRRITWCMVAAAAVVGVTLVCEVPARADEAAAARFFDRMARDAFEARRHDEALELFLLSQRVAPNPRTLFNIALAAELAGRPHTAVAHYAEYLATASDDAPERRQRAERGLERLQRKVATVRVRSEPPGATIYVDRVDHGAVGTTPRLVPVEPGERKILLERDGYHRAERLVSAAVGEDAEVSVSLEPIIGTLSVETTPPEATVVVMRRGERVARSTGGLDRALPVGSYRVRVALDGYGSDATTVIVERDRTTRVHLTAPPLEAESGRLLVSSGAVLDADVLLDGRWVGQTPLTVPQARPGERTVEVRADGYRPWTGDVTVPSGGAVHLPVTLERREAD